MIRRHLVVLFAALALGLPGRPVGPAGRFQPPHAHSDLRLRRVRLAAVRSVPMAGRWLGLHHARAAADSQGADIVRYDVESGRREVLVSARELTPTGARRAARGGGLCLVGRPAAAPGLTNTQPVWRLNTRGDYWVLDRASGGLRKLGGRDAKPSTLMFAKFSPDGGRVAYVRENNLYVEDLASAGITPLTTDGSRTPDQRHVRLGLRRRADELLRRRLALESGRPEHRVLAAQRRSGEEFHADQQHRFAVLRGSIRCSTPKWARSTPPPGSASCRRPAAPPAGSRSTGDPREHYIARMDWAAGSDEVILQRLNRLQNTDEVMLGDARTGAGPDGAHRARLDLGGRGGRPGLARSAAGSSPG